MTDFIAPTVLIMCIAFITATMFMDVFHMAVDTVIMCYITDEEQTVAKLFLLILISLISFIKMANLPLIINGT